MADRDWLGSTNPVYDAQYETWLVNERRLRGGAGVLQELKAFEWEDEEGEHHLSRRSQATYINFPDIFATTLSGFLLREAPVPGGTLTFGTLGEVRRDRSKIVTPTEAELVYYNTNGVGNDGSQWDNYWAASVRRAMATGHRWHFIESPTEKPGTFERILAGYRPYAVEWSPLAVTNWHYDRGLLAFAIVKFYRASPTVINGKMEGQDPNEEHTMLLVRKGFAGLGSDFEKGGWWIFDPDDDPIDGAEGRWDATNGQIPFFPHFYEQDDGSYEEPSMSRGALTELGQLAVSYMNLSSAADFDAWDAASSTQIVIGATREAFNLATDMIFSGGKYASLPADSLAGGQLPTIHDASTGAVTSEVFSTRLDMKRTEAMAIAAMEASGTPDSSGLSKEAGFADTKGPRLAAVASNLEQAQNTAIHFFEQRYGHRLPTGAVTWPRKFDLLDLRDQIQEFFKLVQVSGIRSKTVEANAMALAARQYRVLNDTDEAIALTEYRKSAEEVGEQAGKTNALMNELGAL